MSLAERGVSSHTVNIDIFAQLNFHAAQFSRINLWEAYSKIKISLLGTVFRKRNPEN